jgi:hypothetical protein
VAVLTSIREKLDQETGQKISIKFVKTVNQQVVRVGFPDATLAFFSDMFGPFVETGKHTGFFELNGTEEGIDLVALREEVLQRLPDGVPDKSNRSSDLAEQIVSFRLAEKTSLEAMMFVQKLQKRIRQEAAR